MTNNGAKDIFICATNKYKFGDIEGAVKDLIYAEELAYSACDEYTLSVILVLKAGFLRELGKIDEGYEALMHAEELYLQMSDRGETEGFASLRLEQGIYAKKSGDFALAEKFYLAAQNDAEKNIENDDMGEIALPDVLVNLSSLYIDQGRINEAQVLIKKAINIDRKYNNLFSLSSDLNMLGMLYGQIGDKLLAEQYHKEALKVAVEGGCIKHAADAVSHLAMIAEMDGRQDKAAEHFKQAFDIYMDLKQADEIPNAISDLGIIAMKSGRLDEGIKYLEEAYAAHVKIGDKIHEVIDLINLSQGELSLGNPQKAYRYAVNAVEKAESFGLISYLWAVYYIKAKSRICCLKTNEDHSKDGEILNNEVLPIFAKAVDAIEFIRKGIGHPEERVGLLIDKEELFGEAMLLAGILQQPYNALVFSEKIRSRVLIDMLGSRFTEEKRIMHPLSQRRYELTKELFELNESNSEKSTELLKEIQRIRAQIIAGAPGIAAITEMPSFNEIFEAIPDNAILIEYFIDSHRCLHTFILNSKGIKAYKVLALGEFNLNFKISQYCAELENGIVYSSCGEMLFSLLIGNIWDEIVTAEMLFLVPYKELNNLPFSALWFNNTDDGPEKLYLCQCFSSCTMLPSAAFLPICSNMIRPSIQLKSAFVLGNPTGDLDDAEFEAQLVAERFNVRPLLKEYASKAALLNASSNYSIIHIAAHNIYDDNDPFLSRILLSDEPFTVEEFMESRFSTNLLTLSGCVTGISKKLPGDNLIGFVYAAASSGIPSIISSLWKIVDESSAQFFNIYYQCLLKGMSKAQALGVTQRSFIENEEYYLPMYWAPFVLFGDYK